MDKLDLQSARRQIRPLEEFFTFLGGKLDLSSREDF